MSIITLAHIPPAELEVLLYTLDAAASDLSYRAATIEQSLQSTSRASMVAQRYRGDEEKLDIWIERFSEEATLSSDELRDLIAFLMDLAYHFGGFGCNDLESNFPLPAQEVRREMKRQYYEWIESSEEQDELASFEHPFTTYSSLLGYFAYRLNPDMEKQLWLAKH